MPNETLTALHSAVTTRVHARMAHYRESLAPVGREMADIFDVAAPLLDRGKRLRAAFLAAGWRGFGGRALEASEVQAGAGLELFQLAALVHDDLMDGSLTRRGLPAAHRQFQDFHSNRAMISSAETFGAAGALLLGDLLLVAAEAELSASLLETPGTAPASRAVFEEMMAEVTLGQYLDIYAQSAPWAPDPHADLERAWRVIRAKSARYSVEHPLTLGATMAGATPSQCAAVGEVGLPVGEAFQLRDDVLSVFGDPKITGKPAGDDLREGKRTVLVTLAMTLVSAKDADTLKSRIGDPHLSTGGVEEVRGILEYSGALAQVEDIIGERTRIARIAIDALGLRATDSDLLHDLAGAAIARDL